LQRHQRTPPSRSTLGLIVAGLALASMILGASPAQAATPDGSNDPQVVVALERIEAGTWTQADLAVIRQYPDIAAQVPDPSQPAELLSVSSSGGTAPSGGKTAASLTTICTAYVDAWFQKVSVLGNSIYKWHHYVRYCRNGSAVTSWQARYDYITDEQSGVYVRDLVVNAQWGLGSNSATSHLQRHLEFCVYKVGCYENHYPWSKITVHGNGTYDWTGSTG
jgi:hypothetical protein